MPAPVSSAAAGSRVDCRLQISDCRLEDSRHDLLSFNRQSEICNLQSQPGINSAHLHHIYEGQWWVQVVPHDRSTLISTQYRSTSHQKREGAFHVAYVCAVLRDAGWSWRDWFGCRLQEFDRTDQTGIERRRDQGLPDPDERS